MENSAARNWGHSAPNNKRSIWVCAPHRSHFWRPILSARFRILNGVEQCDADLETIQTMKTPTNLGTAADVGLLSGDCSAFRWAYAAVCALAVKLLEEDNRTCRDNWPAGQSWDDLGASSRSVYLHRARELAGIPHADFLEVVRADSDAVEDIYNAGRIKPNKTDQP